MKDPQFFSVWFLFFSALAVSCSIMVARNTVEKSVSLGIFNANSTVRISFLTNMNLGRFPEYFPNATKMSDYYVDWIHHDVLVRVFNSTYSQNCKVYSLGLTRIESQSYGHLDDVEVKFVVPSIGFYNVMLTIMSNNQVIGHQNFYFISVEGVKVK